MVCFDLFGMRLAVDFTAPALLALLSLILPADALWQTAAACLLHECAHLLMIAALGQKPALLHLSAAGMRLETVGRAVMPLRLSAWILLAGPLANLAAAAGFALCGLREAAAAHLSLSLFNLLPFRSTDGGTLLYLWLEERLLTRAPELPAQILRALAAATAALLLCGMWLLHLRNLSLVGMVAFMVLSEFLEGQTQLQR